MTANETLMIDGDGSRNGASPYVIVHDAVIDMDRHAVLKDGRLTPLEPRVWAVLEYLLTHRDRVVTREELVREVWRGVHVVDEAVMRTISILRDAFGDDPKRPRFIETATKRGYRFIGAHGGSAEVIPVRTSPRPWTAAVAGAVLFLAGLAAGATLFPRQAAPPPLRMIDLNTGEVRTLPQP